MQKEKMLRAVPLLLEWYRANRRQLPWRETADPYKILVSEIMLQQTRVEAVKSYYLRFLAQFPSATALASASEEEVLKAWEGLGYYSRARNLHTAAKEIAKDGFPHTFEGVRALKGVGDYTAGAICSIAFSLPCPAVDGNVLRILTRLFADDSNIDEPQTKKAFTAFLKEVYPQEAGDFCQALMELGAIVCVPNGEPLCAQCPWREICAAHLKKEELSFPVRKDKKARTVIPVTLCVVTCNGKYALQKRGEKGLLAGMWQFPFVEPFGKVLKSKKAKHVFTHVEWHMTGYMIETQAQTEDYVWASAEEIFEKFAIPSAFKAFMDWIK